MKATIKLILSLLLLCHFAKLSRECGPGPSFPRRKILKPMVIYQRLPDVDEESIGGSGMFRRIVTEKSKEYKELVRNYNKDIVFESGDGKRIMTKRCKEKLDKLAKLVKIEWPNVKLRVIEAYDKYGQHPPNSLHYEARAVDITTSDRDKSKIGNLGSLAYQAGFDWVYYESHSYIHASVVSENEVSLKQADCFPSSAKAYSRKHGPIELEKLKVGDHILTKQYLNGHFKEFYTEVLGFLDYVPDINQPYLVFKTEAGHSFATTKSHLIYTISKKSSIHQEGSMITENDIKIKTFPLVNVDSLGNAIGTKYETIFAYSGIESASVNKIGISLKKSVQEKVINIKPAYSLSIGEEIIALSNTSTYTTKITGITIETRKGAVAPLTEDGSFIVNNILASCYAKIHDAELAHTVFIPYRFISMFLPFHTKQYFLDLYVEFLRELNSMFGIVMLY